MYVYAIGFNYDHYDTTTNDVVSILEFYEYYELIEKPRTRTRTRTIGLIPFKEGNSKVPREI